MFWLDSDGAPEAVLGLLYLAALQLKVCAHLQGLRVVSVHLERALTERFCEFELSALVHGKLVSLGALL